MNFQPNQLQQLTQQAIAAARAAGEVIIRHYHNDIQVEHKNRGDSLASQVVTAADREAQAAILERLTPTCAAYNLGLLSEESPDSGDRLEKPAFWSIDPLDGTLAFIEKTAGFSVSIAFVTRSGEALIGVVHDPLTGKVFHAIQGQGIFIDDVTFTPPALDPTRPLVLQTDFSFRQHRWFEATLDGLRHCAETLGLPGADLRHAIGAVMNACKVLQDPNTVYFKYPRKGDSGGSLWDYAATAALFHEAGAIATDINGQPMALNRSDSTFMNHRGILYAANPRIAQCIRNMNDELEKTA